LMINFNLLLLLLRRTEISKLICLVDHLPCSRILSKHLLAKIAFAVLKFSFT
jgi:hypothetical protein